MSRFKEQYKTDAQKYEVAPPLLMCINRKIKNARGRKMNMKFKLKRLIPVIIILAISTTTVFAGVNYVMKYGFAPPVTPPHITTTPEPPMKTAETDQIKLNLNAIVADEEIIYMNFDYETLDETSLQVSTDTHKSVLSRGQFKESYLECEGKKHPVYTSRFDTAQTLNKATFEGMVTQNVKEILGKEVTLVLKDLRNEIEVTADIGFSHSSLTDIYAKGEPEKDFVETGKYITYSDGKSIPSYTLPAGSYKIPFSSKFPNAYIDNFGFQASGEGKSEECFYISIVPGSAGEKAGLEKLTIKNIQAGEKEYPFSIAGGEPTAEQLAFNGDRVVLAFLRQELHNLDENRSLTPENLSKYILVQHFENEVTDLVKSTVSMEFIMENKGAEHKFEVSQTIGRNQVDSITLTPARLKITGSCDYTRDEMSDLYGFKLVMKDGTEVSVGMKVDGWLDATGLNYLLPTLVDVENVVGIKMWDALIELK